MRESLGQFDCFISYAKEDYESASSLFLQLRRSGILPWMDKPPAPFHLTGIRAGEDWELAIRDALAASKYVILLFSTKSVAKLGYVQTEFRQALVKLSRIPAGEVSVIPVRLDDCQVPRNRLDGISFDQLQWVDCFGGDYEALLDRLALDIGIDEMRLRHSVVPRRVSEFLDCMIPGSSIKLQGHIDLSKGDGIVRVHSCIKDVHDGEQIVFQGLSDIEIRAIPKEASVVVSPRYAAVLELENSERITIEGVNFGHTEGFGYCQGSVICLKGCREVVFKDCVLHGSGTYAFELFNCDNVLIEDCKMHACTYGVILASGSRGVRIKGCEVFENTGFSCVHATGSSVEISDCSFYQNEFRDSGRAYPYFNAVDSEIAVKRSSIAKRREEPLGDADGLTFEQCEIVDRFYR